MAEATGGINKINFNKFDKKHKLRSAMMDCFCWMPDKAYLKMVFRIRNGKKLDLDNPKTFCDKMNWLKLHDKQELYTELVDKVEVRKHVEEKIGEGHVFPLLGAWDSFDEIDFDKLPNEFVLKCNHDSGSVRIIRDKSQLTPQYMEEMKRDFSSRLKGNPFSAGREYPYKNVRAKVLAEKLMKMEDGSGINDYKFFCFDGKPEILFVATDRQTDVKFDFYDMEFNHLDIINIHPQSGKTIPKPQCFEEMKTIAAKLSEGMKFVRIDLYEIAGTVYFGEYTFFHAGGFWPLTPDEWEDRLGDLIKLN